jgi:hypothetical protein
MILAAPVPASASHERPEGDGPPELITCGQNFERYFDRRLSGRWATTCEGGDPGHVTHEIIRPPEKGIAVVAFGSDYEFTYTPLRPGPDSFGVRVSDGFSQAETAVDTLYEARRWEFIGNAPRTTRPNRKRYVSGPFVGCDRLFPGAMDCKVDARIRATLRLGGRRRTLTLGTTSFTGVGDGKVLRIRLSKKAVSLLKSAGRIRAKIFVDVFQPDLLGHVTEKRTMPVTLLKPRTR